MSGLRGRCALRRELGGSHGNSTDLRELGSKGVPLPMRCGGSRASSSVPGVLSAHGPELACRDLGDCATDCASERAVLTVSVSHQLTLRRSSALSPQAEGL